VTSTFPVSTRTLFDTTYALLSFQPGSAASLTVPMVSNFNEGDFNIGFGPGLVRQSYTIGTASRVAGISDDGEVGTEFIGSSGDFRLLYNVAQAGATDPAFAFRYVSYAIWDDGAGSERYLSSHLFGFPTQSGVLASNGSSSLSGIVRGRVARFRSGAQTSVSNLSGTATVTINFTTRRVRVQTDLSELGVTTDSSFDIANSSTRFEGVLGGLLNGSVKGELFGPAGEEVGLVFTLSRVDAPTQEEQRIVAVLLAK
jgi:hypothetical protein